MFQVHSVSLEMIRSLRPLVERVRRHDRSLADQIVRAASSVALNIGEGNSSDPGNRKARFHTAAGSANEVRSALQVAVAWGYIAEARAKEADALLDRVLAMLFKLKRG
jgi:four helix bundle protein